VNVSVWKELITFKLFFTRLVAEWMATPPEQFCVVCMQNTLVS